MLPFHPLSFFWVVVHTPDAHCERLSYGQAQWPLTAGTWSVADTGSSDGKRHPDTFFKPYQRNDMNKDQVEGAIEQGKGKLKEAAGDLTGNKNLEAEGELDQAKGKIQKGYGDAKEELKDAIDKL